MPTTRQNPNSPKRYHEETNNHFVACQLQKAEEDADRLAAIAWQKAANELKAVEAEYQRRMEAYDPAPRHAVVARGRARRNEAAAAARAERAAATCCCGNTCCRRWTCCRSSTCGPKVCPLCCCSLNTGW